MRSKKTTDKTPTAKQQLELDKLTESLATLNKKLEAEKQEIDAMRSKVERQQRSIGVFELSKCSTVEEKEDKLLDVIKDYISVMSTNLDKRDGLRTLLISAIVSIVDINKELTTEQRELVMRSYADTTDEQLIFKLQRQTELYVRESLVLKPNLGLGKEIEAVYR